MRRDLLASDEYYSARGQGTDAGFVDAAYQDLVGRNADDGGRRAFLDYLATGADRGQAADVFFNSDEYATKSVDVFYHRFFDRHADSAGLFAWKYARHYGVAIDDVVTAFVGSDEYVGRLSPVAPVAGHHDHESES